MVVVVRTQHEHGLRVRVSQHRCRYKHAGGRTSAHIADSVRDEAKAPKKPRLQQFAPVREKREEGFSQTLKGCLFLHCAKLLYIHARKQPTRLNADPPRQDHDRSTLLRQV